MLEFCNQEEYDMACCEKIRSNFMMQKKAV